METIWISEAEFRAFIWSFKDKAQLEAIDGFNRWVVEYEDGTKKIVRPI